MKAELKCEKAFFAKGLIFSNEKRIKTKAKYSQIMTNAILNSNKFQFVLSYTRPGMKEQTDARNLKTDTMETTTIRFSKVANSGKISSHDALFVPLFGFYKREFKKKKRKNEKKTIG